MIKIARYNHEQKRFEIESTGCEDMDALVDSGHEALHTRARINLFDDSKYTPKEAIEDLFMEYTVNLQNQIDLLKRQQLEYIEARDMYLNIEKIKRILR